MNVCGAAAAKMELLQMETNERLCLGACVYHVMSHVDAKDAEFPNDYWSLPVAIVRTDNLGLAFEATQQGYHEFKEEGLVQWSPGSHRSTSPGDVVALTFREERLFYRCENDGWSFLGRSKRR